jgi:hypothetical protein
MITPNQKQMTVGEAPATLLSRPTSTSGQPLRFWVRVSPHSVIR